MSLEGLSKAYAPHIMKVRVDDGKGALAVLSDIHEGLNNREELQHSVQFLLELGPRCKVVIGGDATNTITRNSKGSVIEEWVSGSDQIFALVDDIRPLYESGQLIGIISGNHPKRVYDETFITIEAMIASILGDRKLYKGSIGIVYFNCDKNLYVHHIMHKAKQTEGAYDYFSADVNWFEHRHKPMARPKIIIEHNKYAKVPVAKRCWDLYQPSFQEYPDYAKSMGLRPSPTGFWICEMTNDVHNRNLIPHLSGDFEELIKNGYRF